VSGGDGADQVGINPCNSKYTSVLLTFIFLCWQYVLSMVACCHLLNYVNFQP